MHQRVIAATCLRFNYQVNAPDGAPNPETQADFTERIWKEQMKNLVKQTEQAAATQTYIKNNPIIDLAL